MSGLKWFPLGAVCGIKTPLRFAVLKPTTVTKKKMTFNLEGKNAVAPGVPTRLRKMPPDEVNAADLDFKHQH